MRKDSVGYKPENVIQPDIPSTWKAMEVLYDSGKARAIGVSNFSSKKLGDLLEVARVLPAVNQVECHPSWQQPGLHAFCKSKGVHLSVSMQIFYVLKCRIYGRLLQNIRARASEKNGSIFIYTCFKPLVFLLFLSGVYTFGCPW